MAASPLSRRDLNPLGVVPCLGSVFPHPSRAPRQVQL